LKHQLLRYMAFGRVGSMQNTSMGCGSHLPTIPKTYKKYTKSK
jgi:hypothetical protein